MVMIRRADEVRVRETASSGTAANLATQTVKIRSIDMDRRIAHAVNQVKGTMIVPFVHMIGKGVGFPAVGETWLISSIFGPWLFVAQVNPSYPVLVEDDDPRLSDARPPIITAPTLHVVGAVGEPAFQNSWVNYDTTGNFQTARFYKDVTNHVRINGRVKSGTGTIFTLPAGYRPSQTNVFACTCGGPGVARVDVNADGTVTVILLTAGATTGDNTSLSLASLSFLAET